MTAKEALAQLVEAWDNLANVDAPRGQFRQAMDDARAVLEEE